MRSSRPETRNPVLALPAVARLGELDSETLNILKEILLDLRRDALARAEKSWRNHKAPMAAYWKAVGVYAGHLAGAIRKAQKERAE